MEKNKTKNRREFIQGGVRLSLSLALGGISGMAVSSAIKDDYVWQIDPFLCTQCGKCATDCIMAPSAVKCVHAFDLCGYCDLCGGYLKPDANEQSTAAENQLCPTAAIERKFIEEPYFEYHIDEDLCMGCGKCVAGCTSFGNGSMHLQIVHDICLNCNQCSIAQVCPSDAISRVKASEAYKVKGDFTNKPEV
ncbi:MAG: ferredoxin [Prolixibacteraceae bacterium]|mgnify:CR=1 FL=1|jgi:Na+-translocating ferredoxin:NAD+ oxidoreductase subunit B|nr:ferredoxin [Prolixibacteraceae bacterium]MBT6763411.1 ferredoxin [Prolixibacteraceae bacterium]MBT6999031.1 ferredoxin [Prolixibacteraceae bacterium]MBT7394470.1 ferredoxin [Prolixibacteraceae bacterium]